MEDFDFDINVKRQKISNQQLLESLEIYSEIKGNLYFSTTEYNSWTKRIAISDTFIDRFGSWNKALKIIGIEGGHERKYSPEELIHNLESVWKELGFPPSKRNINKYGLKISEGPYRRIWGSFSNACKMLSSFHNGNITKEELHIGIVEKNTRETIPLNIRWKVLKRDNYTCKKCGKSPAKNNEVELEIDHIHPVAKGGGNELENLQTLCHDCNQGKKDNV